MAARLFGRMTAALFYDISEKPSYARNEETILFFSKPIAAA
jgi:hypothetical protein